MSEVDEKVHLLLFMIYRLCKKCYRKPQPPLLRCYCAAHRRALVPQIARQLRQLPQLLDPQNTQPIVAGGFLPLLCAAVAAASRLHPNT